MRPERTSYRPVFLKGSTKSRNLQNEYAKRPKARPRQSRKSTSGRFVQNAADLAPSWIFPWTRPKSLSYKSTKILAQRGARRTDDEVFDLVLNRGLFLFYGRMLAVFSAAESLNTIWASRKKNDP